MPTFIGFNTVDQPKKFTLTNFDLVKRDFLNAINIRQGQLVGRPGYGTTLWDNLFESQTQATQAAIEREIQRVAGLDPRLYIKSINAYPQQNGILLEVDAAMVPSTDAQRLSIFLDQESRRASYI
jgi:phage baseplate assembly protein W